MAFARLRRCRTAKIQIPAELQGFEEVKETAEKLSHVMEGKISEDPTYSDEELK